ncbi:hypothetical protein AB0D40_31855 [Streptomyces massasporeus]|uniref:hypothetical protein n=1 Tax=Streptomyces massasporeus TaxID=67324 RepID=UPI00340DDAB9
MNGKWYVNRFKACGIFVAKTNVHDVRTGRLLGSLDYLVRAYAYGKRDIALLARQPGSGAGVPAGGSRWA